MKIIKYFVIGLWIATPLSYASSFSIKVGGFDDGDQLTEKQVANTFGCQGQNISPSVKWENPPEGTKSFALTVYDPDAPTGSGWWHWTVFNIPVTITQLKEGVKKLPRGAVQGRTDFGKPGYGGPCPPVGDKPHHYIFTVYALKVPKLDLNKNSPGAQVGYNVNFNHIEKASVTLRYGRK